MPADATPYMVFVLFGATALIAWCLAQVVQARRKRKVPPKGGDND